MTPTTIKDCARIMGADRKYYYRAPSGHSDDVVGVRLRDKWGNVVFYWFRHIGPHYRLVGSTITRQGAKRYRYSD